MDIFAADNVDAHSPFSLGAGVGGAVADNDAVTCEGDVLCLTGLEDAVAFQIAGSHLYLAVDDDIGIAGDTDDVCSVRGGTLYDFPSGSGSIVTVFCTVLLVSPKTSQRAFS